MKKFRWILLLLGGLLLLSGCGSRKETTSVSANAGDEIVNVILDLSYTFEDEEGMAAAMAEEWNCISHELLGNGSAIYTLHRRNLEAWIESVEQLIRQDAERLTKGEERVPSFLSIEAKDGYRIFEVKTDRNLYTPGDSIYAYLFILNGIYYQDLMEVPVEKIDTVVNFVDGNGELIAEMSYHELREDISALPEGETEPPVLPDNGGIG